MKKSTPYMNAYSVTTDPQKIAWGYTVFIQAFIAPDRNMVRFSIHAANYSTKLPVFGTLKMTLAEYSAAFENITDDGEYFNKAAGVMGVELLP